VEIANAQESNNPKHSFGVRAGINFAKPISSVGWVDEEIGNKFGIGFHLGGTYEIALSKSRKWYFQTGLNLKYLTSKAENTNTKLSDYGTYTIHSNKYKALYFEVPAIFMRKIRFTDEWGFQPAIGLSYALGVSAKNDQEKVRYERNEHIYTKNEKVDLFSEDDWVRNTINAKLVLNFTYKNYLIGAGLSYGACDLWDLGISFGYNF